MTKRIKTNDKVVLKELKEFDNEGWELVQFINKFKGMHTAILKKEIKRK